MDKRKKIIISLSISLILVIAVNYIVISLSNSSYIEVLVFKQDILKGKQVTLGDVETVVVKKTAISESLYQKTSKEEFIGKVLKEDVSKGERITKNKFVDSGEILQDYGDDRYISIPITNASYPTCINLKRGDKVSIYYTAKTKDVSEAIKDKQRLYSNANMEGMVTCLLFENIEIISVHDSTGKQTNQNIITDIIIRLNKEEAILVANLKSQGVFDIVLN